ncbi:tryptophan--tRNA ligase, partial [Candidatus Microgenomates bacterium]
MKRALTGMRTTGRLHLGHYIGALEQWLQVQERGDIECFFLLADVQALTTHADRPEILAESIRDVVLDWLAVGLDPALARVHFVLQSQVPERAALSMLLQMIAYRKEVERNPTLKTELKQQADGRKVTMGFMTYPVDQVADILMVCPYPPKREDELLVPVGEDQVPHLEYARTLAKRFNEMYGRRIFLPCKPMVGRVGRLVGIDGQAKMSKSLNNAIYLSDDS